MPLELPREARQTAIESIERYFEAELEQRIGNIQAGALLNFMLQEIGPSIYNLAVREAQERLSAQVQQLDLHCHEDEFQFWARQAAARTRKRGG